MACFENLNLRKKRFFWRKSFPMSSTFVILFPYLVLLVHWKIQDIVKRENDRKMYVRYGISPLDLDLRPIPPDVRIGR